MKNDILVDSIYTFSPGGLQVLNYISKGLPDNTFYLIDYRLKGTILFNKFKYLKNELDRYFFYKKNSDFKKHLCISNVPPPISKKNTIIFFHNTLYLSPFNSNLNLKNQIVLYIKSLYIRFLNNENNKWVVQTELVKQKLSKFNISLSNIHVFPIFPDFKPEINYSKRNTFVYVTSESAHKNNKNLLNGFIDAALSLKSQIILNITLNEKYTKNLSLGIIPKNLFINYHGRISFDEVIDIYKQSHYLIYPSIEESFGLPLIESINYGCKVLCSNLPYAHEIIVPSLIFDPWKVDEITSSILTAVNNDLPKSEKKIVNKLDEFIDFINN